MPNDKDAPPELGTGNEAPVPNANQSNPSEPELNVGVRVPPFCPEEPALWFAQVEGQFVSSGITSDSTKFYYVIAQLNHQYATEVKEIITSPPANNKYDKLKTELVKRLSESREKRLQQLPTHEELGDRKPSQFLRHLRTLAGQSVPDVSPVVKTEMFEKSELNELMDSVKSEPSSPESCKSCLENDVSCSCTMDHVPNCKDPIKCEHCPKLFVSKTNLIRHYTMEHPPEIVVKNETDSDVAMVTCESVTTKNLEQQKDFVLPESDADDRSNPVSDTQFCEKSELNELVDAVKNEPPPDPLYINLENKNFTIEENKVKIEALSAEFSIKREPSPEPSSYIMIELMDAVKNEPPPEPSYINLDNEKITIEENNVKPQILNAELNNTDSQPVGIENKPEMVGTDDPRPVVVDRYQPEEIECDNKGKRNRLQKTVYCELCDKHIQQKSYKRHQITHSDKKPFYCNICSKAFKYKDYLRFHMTPHSDDSRPFSCDICSMKYKRKHCLATHMKCHSDRPFTCDICSIKFKWKASLASHINTHSDDSPFTCDICNVKFKRKYELARHSTKKCHTKSCSCDICSYRFNLKHDLAIHMKSHTENKQHACPICQKCFAKKCNMEEHFLTHKINPLICPVCHEEHSSTVSRKRHMTTHFTGNGPFKCEHCPKLYQHTKHLLWHYKRVHPPKKLTPKYMKRY